MLSAHYKVILLSGHLSWAKCYWCLDLTFGWTKVYNVHWTSAHYKVMLVSGHICSLQSDPVVWTSALGKVLLVSGLKICLDKSLQCPVDIRSLQSDAGVWTGQKSTSAHYKVILLSGHICSVQSDAGVWKYPCARLKLVSGLDKNGHLLTTKLYNCLDTSAPFKVMLVSGLNIWLDKSLQCPLDNVQWTSAHYKVMLVSGHICSLQGDAGVWVSAYYKVWTHLLCSK